MLFHLSFYRLRILIYHQNRQYKIYLDICAMLNKYTIENSLTHSSIQKTSHDIQSVYIYIEKQFFTYRQFEFAAHYMQNEYLAL